MTLIEDAATTKLHIDAAGYVWYTASGGMPINSGQQCEGFLNTSTHCSGPNNVIRVLGSAQNAELISTLYVRQRQKEIARVQIAGPNICESADELLDPALAIMRMRASNVSPACGGWHDLTDREYPMYAMIARMSRNHGVMDGPVSAYFKVHPAYQALKFLPTLSEENAVKLLGAIVDPRWYVDRRAPEKTTKMLLFLGLLPAVQKRVSNLSKIVTRTRDIRCAIVLNCWKRVSDDLVNFDEPGNFLWRIWRANGGGYKGDLRASQSFVRYLRYNWLSSLETRRGVKDGLFAPNLFFKTADEREAYRLHMAQEV